VVSGKSVDDQAGLLGYDGVAPATLVETLESIMCTSKEACKELVAAQRAKT